MQSIIDFLNTVWVSYAIFAYFLSIVMLFLYVYASTGVNKLYKLQRDEIKEREKIYSESFGIVANSSRLLDIDKHIVSDNPNDWKLAIIEADVILDDVLKEAGYGGVSLGERLKSISSNQLRSLDDAWQAHKVRNQIAHGGADFILTKRLADDTIKQYKRVLTELGVR
ncbi:MAG: hypothetical protein R3B60_02430 [Candidatus Paceibacterota bacterium]